MISSHSPFATEATIGAWLLLFRPAAIPYLTIRFCNPWLSDIAFYCITLLLSFPTPKRGSRTKCPSGMRSNYPGGFSHRFSSIRSRSSSVSWSPVTQSLKERFRFSLTYWTSVDQVHFVQTSALLMRRPGGLIESEVFQLSNPFRFHIFQAALYRSPDESNLI